MNSIKTNIADILSLLQDTNIRGSRPYNRNRTGRGGHGGRQNQTQPHPHAAPPRVYYCWSHGVTTGDHRVSTNCEEHKPGHRENATALNHMGGSTEGLE
eukprot:11039722-Ditylum_brightwellii.AAC.1